MSNAIPVGEHHFILPPAPTSQEEVLFVKLPKDQQYWRRQKDFPPFFFDWNYDTELYSDLTFYDSSNILISLNREDSAKLLRLREREMERRVKGVWFMNNGELTYLTGGHYFMLQWGAMQGYANPRDEGSHFGQYREFQRDVHYFIKLCKRDPECLGGYISKPKKTGVTQLFMLDYLDESTRMRGKLFGIASKTFDDDCKKVNFGYYTYGLNNLPAILKPSIKNLTQSYVYFGNPEDGKNANRTAKKRSGGANTFLDTSVIAHATKAKAFDGGKYYRALISEFPKIKDTTYPADIFEPTTAAVKMQNVITGKFFIESYVPETDDKSTEQAHKIWIGSALKTKGAYQRTSTELYRYAISVIDAAENSFDIYGKADKVGNWHFITTGLAKRKDNPDQVLAFRRQNPTCEDDMWLEGAAEGAIFNNLKLGEKKNELMEDQALGVTPYVTGNLKWIKDPEINMKKGSPNYGMYELQGCVYFEPDSEEALSEGKYGPFRMYSVMDKDGNYIPWMDLLDKDSFNYPFRYQVLHEKNRRIKPHLLCPYFAGMDPTNYAMKKHVVTASKNALYIMNFPDPKLDAYHKQVVTNRIVMEYIYRRDTPNDTLMDVLKVLAFFGCYIAAEGNMPWLITRLIEMGFANFVIVKNKEGFYEPYDEFKHQKLITTQNSGANKSVNDYVLAGKQYLGSPDTPVDFDYMRNLNSIDLISDLMKFDTGDTKKFDAAMAFLICLVVMRAFMGYRQQKLEKMQQHDAGTMSAVVGHFLDG